LSSVFRFHKYKLQGRRGTAWPRCWGGSPHFVNERAGEVLYSTGAAVKSAGGNMHCVLALYRRRRIEVEDYRCVPV
jgi:hypothetical protein